MHTPPRPTPAFDGVTPERFEREIQPLGRPAVLRGLVKDWPAARAAAEGPEALAAYLARHDLKKPVGVWRAKPELNGRFFYSDDLKGFNHDRDQRPLATLLGELIALQTAADPPSVYAGAVPIPEHLPGLLAENPCPVLDDGLEKLVSLWVGNRTRTATHYDLSQNVACVLSGRRRFTLFPPDQVKNLYPGPLDFTLAGQPVSLVDPLNPDLDRFPRYAEAAAAAEVAELGPGDALYVPSLWWHHVESLEPFGAMVNFWWRDGPAYMVTPMFSLLHCQLTIRELPDAEREAWRAMFDYFVFRTGGDPVAHLPADARGVLGEMTPELIRRLKSIVAGPLR